MRSCPRIGVILLLSLIALRARAADTFEPLPPPATKPLVQKDLDELKARVAALARQIDQLRSELRDRPKLLDLLPDVEIYLNAVRYPLTYDEPIDPRRAAAALAAGMERA